MKKRWLFIPLIMVGLLALVATSGAIFAQGNGHPGGGGAVKGLASRVAEILDLDEETVQTAFNQAIREHQDEHLQAILDRLVEAERLAQDEANAIMRWYQARPDAAIYLKGVLLRGEEALQHRLDRMLEAEVITQEEVDAVMSWYESRPDSLPTRGYGRFGPGHTFKHGPARGDDGVNDKTAFRGAPQRFTSPVTRPAIFY
jgi:hypothetical protein